MMDAGTSPTPAERLVILESLMLPAHVAPDAFKTGGSSPPKPDAPEYYRLPALDLSDGTKITLKLPKRKRKRYVPVAERRHLLLPPELQQHLDFIHKIHKAHKQREQNRRTHYQLVRGLRLSHTVPCWTGDAPPHIDWTTGDVHVPTGESLPSRVLTREEAKALYHIGGWAPTIWEYVENYRVVYSSKADPNRLTRRGYVVSKADAAKYALTIYLMRVPDDVKAALYDTVVDRIKSNVVSKRYGVSVEMLYTYTSRVRIRAASVDNIHLAKLEQITSASRALGLSWSMRAALLEVIYYHTPTNAVAEEYDVDPRELRVNIRLIREQFKDFISNAINELQVAAD